MEGVWQGNAVLYDQQSDSLWMQLTGKCFRGPHAGRSLTPLDTGRHTTWQDWLRTYPRTSVLAQDPRLAARPDTHGYYFSRRGSRSGHSFLPKKIAPTIETRDTRLQANTLLYGVLVDGEARAYPFARLRARPVVDERLTGVDATIWFDESSRSAAAFRRSVKGHQLSFRRVGEGRFMDMGTRSHWTMDGLCVEGPLKGTQLKRLRGVMSEWFGWSASYPKTTIFTPR